MLGSHSKTSRPILIVQLTSFALGIILVVGGLFQQMVLTEGPPLAVYILPGIALLGTTIVLSIYEDLERKKMEKAMFDSEEMLRRVFEATSDGIIVTDLNGRILDCNQAVLAMHCYSTKEEIIGKNSLELFAGADREKALKRMQSLLSPEKDLSRSVEYTLITKDGHEFPGELSFSVALDTSGKPKYAVTTSEDITERKMLEKELRDYMEHLEDRVEAKTRRLKDTQAKLVRSERLAAIGQVAAMVGHDLRNPLTGIVGAVYCLKKQLVQGADAKAMEMLELIRKNVEHSEKIISDLLDYSRELHLELEETTPQRIVKEALSMVQIPKYITVSVLVQDRSKITVDREKMKRAFVNIVKNAVDAMPNGGLLAITDKTLNGKCLMSFRDTGIGMTKETLEKLWSPFFTTKTKGMGLGLAICKRIVEAHGGRIIADSSAGKGTTFTVVMSAENGLKKKGEDVHMEAREPLVQPSEALDA